MAYDAITDNWKKYGIYIQAGIGNAYPELKAQTLKILVDRVGSVPWVPAGWADAVRSLNAQYPDALIKGAPALMRDGSINPNAPAWLDTAEKRQWWQEMANATSEAQSAYAANEITKGRAIMDAAYARAEFWSRAYDFANAVAEAPKRVISAAGDLATGATWALVKGFIVPAAVIAGVFILWTNRHAFAKAAGKKFGA